MKLKPIRLLLVPATLMFLLTACGGGPYLTGIEAEELVKAHIRERYLPKPESKACTPTLPVFTGLTAVPYHVLCYLEPALWQDLYAGIDFWRELAVGTPEFQEKKYPQFYVTRDKAIEGRRLRYKEFWEEGGYKPPIMTHKYDDSDNTWLISVLFGPTRSRETYHSVEDKGQLYDVYASWKVNDKIFTVVPQSGTALGKCY